MFIADFLSRYCIDNFGTENKSINYYVHIINTKKVEFSCGTYRILSRNII